MSEPERKRDNRYRTAPMPSRWPSMVPPDKPEPLFEVALRCGHTNGFVRPAPGPGEYAYCHRCQATTRVALNRQRSQ